MLNEKFKRFALQSKRALIERDEVIDCFILALLAKEHAMYLGKPGTAKSLLSRLMTKAFNYIGSDGSKPYFDVQLNGFTEYEKVFGPRDVKEYLDHGKVVSKTENYFPNARIVLIDEITRANKAVSDSLLKGINERLFEQDGQNITIPLETCLCTTNFKYSSNHFEALADRILFWHEIEDTSDDSFDALVDGNFDGACITETFTEEEVRQARKEVSEVVMTQATKDTLKTIKVTLRDDKKIRISDRKLLKMVKVIKAAAWLAGRKETKPIDCRSVINCIWNDPEHKPVVNEVIKKICIPEEEIIDRVFNETTTMVKNHSEQPSVYPIDDVAAKLVEARNQLESMLTTVAAENKAYLESQLNRIIAIQKPIAEKYRDIKTGRRV